jgi:hypothetical protein
MLYEKPPMLSKLGFILSISSCSVEETVALPKVTCFNDNSSAIEQLPWLKTVVSEFQKPKSGPVQVVLYVYNHEYAKTSFN